MLLALLILNGNWFVKLLQVSPTLRYSEDKYTRLGRLLLDIYTKGIYFFNPIYIQMLGTRARAKYSFLGTESAKPYSINPVHQFGYDPVQEMLDNIRASGLSLEHISEAIGSLYAPQYAGNHDLRLLRERLNEITGEYSDLRQNYAREAIDYFLDPEGSFWQGNTEEYEKHNEADPERATEFLMRHDEFERNRLAQNAEILGDARFDAYKEKQHNAITKGTAPLETYRMANPIGKGDQADINSLKAIWIQMLIPSASLSDIREALLGIGFSKPPKEMRFFIDQIVEKLMPANPFALTGQGLNNITQAYGELLANNPRASVLYTYAELARQLSERVDLKAVFDVSKSYPLRIIKIMLPMLFIGKIGPTMIRSELEKYLGIDPMLFGSITNADNQISSDMDVAMAEQFDPEG